ncbi:MAG: 1-deoxy-D-xylulose-5-phosphate synthase [Ruminococcaceae bacterium]|nr:1-deoxy-D-xylulose-5-phosphate synthase [Oscillospiraceae bacterium]
MKKKLLSTIKKPRDLRKFGYTSLTVLCNQIREMLVDTVSKTGGHLSPNLGAVELTVSILRNFDVPKDSIVFDVGHQCYTYKILTDRMDKFHTLRQSGGISGFPRPYESEYDIFTSGHSSTSLSSAIGLARAKKLNGDKSKVIAIVGDGAMSGGMIYEAMNNIDSTLDNLIVVLNDNRMSISKSVGGISRYLLHIRTNVEYEATKNKVKNIIEKAPYVGRKIAKAIAKSKNAFRRYMYDGRLFEDFGFNYIGPVDGHDIVELDRLFKNAKSLKGPLFIHCITVKGKGYTPAEVNPGAYHGVGKFDFTGDAEDITLSESFSNIFGKKLADLASRNNKICAVTAAMKYATGLNFFSKEFPERFFDVGIAEQHAVTFSAGLAKGGMKPVFAVYSTFLQRAFDQLFQDVSLDDLDVLLAIDRAGIVGEDGETHHGIFDVSFLNSIGKFFVLSPSNYEELEYWLERLIDFKGPKAVRYPRGPQDKRLSKYKATGKEFDLIESKKNNDFVIVSYGRIIAEVFDAAKMLKSEGIDADIIKLNVILPLPAGLCEKLESYKKILFVEEGIIRGGVGSNLLRDLMLNGYKGDFYIKGIEKSVKHATVKELIKNCELDGESLASFARKRFC